LVKRAFSLYYQKKIILIFDKLVEILEPTTNGPFYVPIGRKASHWAIKMLNKTIDDKDILIEKDEVNNYEQS
jgi:hypothetical protein